MLFACFLMSCDNEKIDDNYTLRPLQRKDQTHISDEQTQRISYDQYVELYDDNLDTNNTTNVRNSPIEDIPAEKSEKTEKETKPPKKLPSEKTRDNQLASYSTPLLASSNERINNLEIVCGRLNNFILNPNDSFSYNQVAGPYGADDGFEEATILLSDGTKTKGYGGGVCQLSSTLYNVIKNIDNVEITERHHHSSPVAYVPENEDATVSLQSGLDFKFINKNNYPIRFEAECADGYVTVWACKEK